MTSRTAWIAHILAILVIGEFALAATGTYWNPADLAASIPFLCVLAITLAVGWMLAWKRSRNPLGWMLMAVPALFGSVVPVALIATALLDSAPTVSAWLFWYASDTVDTWSWLPPVAILLTQVPLFFPDGRLPSPRWRWFWAFTLAAISVSCILISASPEEVHPGVPNPMAPLPIDEPWLILLVFGGLLATSFVGAVVSLIVRYRGAGDLERAQVRWVLWAVGTAVSALVATWALPADWEIVNQIVVLLYGLIPISIAIAVLRYRLFEIDRIISRTAAYAIVSLLIVGVYALIVTSVTWLLPDAPAVGVATATLAAAALFLPALRWVRRRVDRRFDREQYSAQHVVDDFGERLRTGEDPHRVAGELIDAAERTLQPTSVGLWIAGGR